jgi:hypothetical protein
VLIERNDLPKHLFRIPDLDLSNDLCAEPLAGPWFRLGACSAGSGSHKQGVENVVYRQSILLIPEDFGVIFEKLESTVGSIGKPGGSLISDGQKMVYRYAPFHRFERSFTPAVVEPLVFFNSTGSGTSLLINPDLWLFFKLEEKTSGIWRDPPKGVEVVRQHVIEPDEVEIVEIRVEYLSKYLQARQMALLVEHTRRLQLYNPPKETVERFEECTLTLGSSSQGMKAIINSDHREDVVLSDPFLLRTLRLWFQITPPPIDIEDPWAEEPLFDPYTFTLFTDSGSVAPADGPTFDKLLVENSMVWFATL